ncbi:carbamoyltransferase [Candidatus Woesearchaeota archaeon]|nr:carbamoyltransferase [Candidatus Woesearchaeota archaeon]
MHILGISCYYHDSSACLIKDGIIVAAAEEERFTRKKHDTSFPINAINFCLKEAGITSDRIDWVAFYEKPLLKFERLLNQHIEMFPRSFPMFYQAMPNWLSEKLRISSTIKKKLKYKKPVFYTEHHMSHAASSFLVSPFKEAAILTVDGIGEWDSTTLGIGKENDIKIIKRLHFPHSLGLLYSTLTAFLGFSVNNSEYKVMGLAPYGEPTYYDEFKKIIDIKDDGSYKLNMDYFVFHYKSTMPSKKMMELLGPMRKKEDPVTKRHKDIAASLQKITEEAIFKMLNHLHEITGTDNLCMAGGVALNSVANGKITKNTPFKKVFINPAAGDAGGSMGAALYAYNTILGNSRKQVFESPYLGPGYSNEYIQAFLEKNNIVHSKFKNDEELIKKTAQLIHDNNVIGWYQGRMEWGPRALGARSILSNACNPNMKEILNTKVKHREHFRPFAPVITEEDVHEWFEIDKDEEPYMLFVYPVKEDKRKLIPSVTHVDGSGRLQTINNKQNSRYYGVIKEFEKLSGIPILINTSFNIRGEPIVCSPYEAYKCMMGTGIDYLVMGDFLIKRQDNQQHIWDSESLATD